MIRLVENDIKELQDNFRFCREIGMAEMQFLN